MEINMDAITEHPILDKKEGLSGFMTTFFDVGHAAIIIREDVHPVDALGNSSGPTVTSNDQMDISLEKELGSGSDPSNINCLSKANSVDHCYDICQRKDGPDCPLAIKTNELVYDPIISKKKWRGSKVATEAWKGFDQRSVELVVSPKDVVDKRGNLGLIIGENRERREDFSEVPTDVAPQVTTGLVSMDRVGGWTDIGVIIRDSNGDVLASYAQTLLVNLNSKSANLTAMLKSVQI
ncbi:hypothetical protein QYF36_018933 [Acer negundo]|nr:hypothetical protein QYF36_018933 [Acer negundo]